MVLCLNEYTSTQFIFLMSLLNMCLIPLEPNVIYLYKKNLFSCGVLGTLEWGLNKIFTYLGATQKSLEEVYDLGLCADQIGVPLPIQIAQIWVSPLKLNISIYSKSIKVNCLNVFLFYLLVYLSILNTSLNIYKTWMPFFRFWWASPSMFRLNLCIPLIVTSGNDFEQSLV